MAFYSASAKTAAAAISVVGAAGTAAYLWSTQNKQSARCWSSTGHLKYPASCNFPDLSKHNNVMADQLTPDVCSIKYINLFFSIYQTYFS